MKHDESLQSYRETRPLRDRSTSTGAIGLTLLMLASSVPLLSAERPQPRLGEYYRQLAAEAAPLLTEGEAELLSSLAGDSERERFWREFWNARGEADRLRLLGNREDTQRFSLRAAGQRAVMLLTGKPSRIVRYEACESVVRRLEVWHFDDWRVQRQNDGQGKLGTSLPSDEARDSSAVGASPESGVFLVFVQRTNFDPRSFELWDRKADQNRLVFGEGRGIAVAELVKEAIALGCVGPQQAAELRRALEGGLAFDEIVAKFGWDEPESAWWERENPLGEPLGGDLASLSIREVGKFSRHTLIEGKVKIPVEALATLVGSELFDRIEILGDIYLRDRLMDGFRVVHHVAGKAPSVEMELDFYRRLLPGEYLLKLRVENRAGEALLRDTRRLEVSKMEEKAVQPARRRRDINRLTRAEVVFLTTSPSLEIIPPETYPVGGAVTVEAVLRGSGVERVLFEPEGEAPTTDTDPPFLAQVSLSTSRQRLVAKAQNAAGATLASDVVTLRRDAKPFRVWFTDSGQPETQLGTPVAASAGHEPSGSPTEHLVRVQVPEEETLSEVVCYQNGTKVRTFLGSSLSPNTETFRCPKQPPRADTVRVRFDRVVATLESGEVVEDVLFLSKSPDQLDVRLVELFVSVLDQTGRPSSGLTAEQFTVLEDGVPQPIERVTAVERLPLAVSVMLDTSSSMGRRARVAVQSTQRFYRRLMKEGDVASLFSFNHDLSALADFTDDARELEYAAQGLRGSGGTRLHDGLVYNLHSFAGLPSRRAMVVLSDGADTESDATFDEALEAARRSGVLIFPVALGAVGEATVAELRRLASETGGSLYQVASLDELDGVYEQIVRILRSQYQVVYRPLGEETLRGYQPVEIKIAKPGLSVRNVRGYYR